MAKLEVLYVEDDIGDATLLCEQFGREDADLYHLNHTSNLTDALALLEARSFNAILLDLHLPDGDGLNNIETLKAIRPDVPIVILTGTNDERKAEEALLKGAQEYIVKNDATCAIIKRILQSSILRQKAEIALVHKAHHDPLTDLPNRAAFEETATMLIKRAQRWDRKEALMFIDLNDFKEINDNNHGIIAHERAVIKTFILHVIHQFRAVWDGYNVFHKLGLFKFMHGMHTIILIILCQNNCTRMNF